MAELKRYDFHSGQGEPFMREVPNGKWALAEDVIQKAGEVMREVQRRQFLVSWDEPFGSNMKIEDASRMFLAPETEVPEAIRDLLSPTAQNFWQPSKKEYDTAVIEAYKRGKAGK